MSTPLAQSSPPAPWLIVARREITARLTDKAFVLGTLLMVVIIGAFMGVSTYLGDKETTYTLVTTSAPDAAQVQTLAPAITDIDPKVKVKEVSAPDEAAARALVKADGDTLWLHSSATGWVLLGNNEVPGNLKAATESAVRAEALAHNAAAAGTSVSALTAGSVLSTDVLNGDAKRQDFAKGMGFALAFLFYMASLTLGMTLAGSVVEEKSSRLVEIIVARIPVRQLLAGKVLGHILLAVAQLGIYLGVGLVGLSLSPYASFLPSVSDGIGWFVAFFLVGFVLLACLWAVAGALASRSEDLQSTAMPVSFLLMGLWFSAFLAKDTWLVVLSFLPPFSTVLMPMRVLQGSVPLWQPLAALALLVVAAGGVILVAERLYRRSLLQTQGRVSLKAAWTAAE